MAELTEQAVLDTISSTMEKGLEISALEDTAFQVQQQNFATLKGAKAKEGEADTVLSLAEQVQALQTSEDIQLFYAAQGGTDQLIKLAAAQKEATDNYLKQAQDVIDLQDYDTFWEGVVAEWQRPTQEAELRTAAGHLNQISGSIQNVQTAIEAASGVLGKANKISNAATMRAALDKSAAVIDQEKAKLDIATSDTQLTMYKAAQDANADQLSRISGAYRIQMDAKILDQRVKEYEAQQAERARLLAEKKVTDDTYVEGVQRIQKKTGGVIDSADVILTGRRVGGEPAKKYDALYIQGTDTPVIGTSAANAYVLLENSPESSLNDTDNNSSKLMRDSMSTLQTQAAGKQMKKAELETAYNAVVAKTASDAAEDVTTEGNYYAAPPMSVVADSVAVQQDKFYQQILKPLGLSEFDEARIIELGLSAMQDGTLKLEEVKTGIKTLAQSAAAKNNEIHQYSNYHIPAQTTYKVPRALIYGDAPNLQVSSMFAETVDTIRFGTEKPNTVDLMDETEIISALIRAHTSNIKMFLDKSVDTTPVRSPASVGTVNREE